ncbi:MAG: HEAT repeat domain-containing protein, partial [Planctomycetia bacterium]|nr:HEAT repeat domain-containing protein [Planctomycetia bacterium]
LAPMIDMIKDPWPQDRGTPGWYSRREVAMALAKIGDKRAVGPLLEMLKQEHDYYYIQQHRFEDPRCSAAMALGEMKDARAVAPLIAALKDKNEHLRREAARALGKIGDKRALGPLNEALNDKDAYGKFVVERALAEIRKGAAGKTPKK